MYAETPWEMNIFLGFSCILVLSHPWWQPPKNWQSLPRAREEPDSNLGLLTQ
jgi:hypothetical protein